ncbi:MAG: helix-turn-helix transcriptional regulator [Planctomycetota bacterium]
MRGRGAVPKGAVHFVVSRSGSPRLVYSSKWPIRGHGGAFIGLVGTNRPHESVAGDQSSRVLPAVARMIRDHSCRLSVTDLARECGLSASHFMRLFRRQMSKTAQQFFEHVRIAEARRLLRETALPVADVAAACGFYDASGFVKRFRLHTGLNPLASRKRRNDQPAAECSSASEAGGRMGDVGSHRRRGPDVHMGIDNQKAILPIAK